MSMKTSHTTLRTCTAADGTTIPKGGRVELAPDDVLLWAQDGKIAKPGPPQTSPVVPTDSTAPAPEK